MSTVDIDVRWAAQLRNLSPSPGKDPDAGLRAVTHYERRLPPWRHQIRELLIPIVRAETPYLAAMQRTCRSPVLDSYFAFTANLGTHTFFMMALPICFWFGYPDVGVALVHMLAFGVYLSGAVKDLVCLPRPLSPPLQRITMSGSAALEYGFPSTHTTNAVSVAFFALHQMYQTKEDWSPSTYALVCLGFYCYAVSISVGRMYCGMHGFFDVVIGFMLGALITWVWTMFGTAYAVWVISDTWLRPALSVVILGLLIRFHPEPADNCPCFDDSVAFLGVVMGIAIGTWHNSQRWAAGASASPSLPAAYNFSNQDPVHCAARLFGGIVVIFLWRAVAKPSLLRTLPPTFRFVDHWGRLIPRRYFLQAGDYQQVPTLTRDDNVLPAASDIPSMLSSFRNPRRRRVSVGPQSEADAREYLANRAQSRSEGRTTSSVKRSGRNKFQFSESPPSPISEGGGSDISSTNLQVHSIDEQLLTPPASDAGNVSDSSKDDEKHDREIFSALEKPRVRYDVEVITKVVVYTGIAWLAVEGNPILFERFGLV